MSKWLSQEWLDETRKLAESQPEIVSIREVGAAVVDGHVLRPTHR